MIVSDLAPLTQVIVHRPGKEMLRLTPSNKDELLFDDLLWLERAQEEHDAFAKALGSRGAEVLYFEELLAQALHSPQAREQALTEVVTSEAFGCAALDAIRSYAESLSPEDLAELLIAGITKRELLDRVSVPASTVIGAMNADDFILTPLPNHLFTRDTSAWIHDGVFIGSMCKRARLRESVNARIIYSHHPRFSDTLQWDDGRAGTATVEGGDIMVLGNDTVIVGMGERTNAQGVERLALKLFEGGTIAQVIAMEMPKARALMHFDTAMTMADEGTFVKYAGLGMLRSHTIRPGMTPGTVSVTDNPGEDMHQVIAGALGIDSIRVLHPPMDTLAAEREQWNDGSNLLAIAPGVVIAYERNTVTNDYLESQGLTVVPVPGNELGRGRGGPRCMSCPIARASDNN
ncbi:arginine deiminase [Schaalia canis]|uniref:Arginine deiminase n=1 Tax=Schaalia canis TaxID=100469 RepID=A0A3P1SFK6_9ACTO|nr:arginine deiminase [Schaalia canis]RRC95535.1 arginine deiminase [Schaalia canis]